MAKTQMQLANRAWRTETKSLGWHHGWKTGRRGWRAFCRENAVILQSARNIEPLPNDEIINDQLDADSAVIEEMSNW